MADLKFNKQQLPTLEKADVGLGNVPNVTTNNQTPTFTQASSRENVASGESLATLFGKIMKWFTDLKSVAFSGSYSDLSNTPSSLPANGGAADTLKTARTIALSQGATGTATSFDGSANITIPVTALDASKLTGTVPLASMPAGALERLVVVANDTARFALTTSNIQLGDTVKVTDTGKMYYVVDESKLNQAAGYEVYTAGVATSVPWSGITDKPTTFTPATHTHTASDVGLGNVSNVTTNNQTPTFTQASSRENVASGESLATLFGKIMKWFSDLKSVAFSGSYSDLSNTPSWYLEESDLSSQCNGSRLAFTLPSTIKSFSVYLNGQRLVNTTNFTYNNNTTLTLTTTPPPTGSTLIVVHMKVVFSS
ncbi:MAG: hypothetical protein LBD91_08500 [Prevotellaceae bacterium]|jgi:hypothetical protein|nr:hypothetical protein [Prevotellaceae bacterium]